MVVEVTHKDVRNITDAALLVSVILAWTFLPAAVIINVVFPRWVLVA